MYLRVLKVQNHTYIIMYVHVLLRFIRTLSIAKFIHICFLSQRYRTPPRQYEEKEQERDWLKRRGRARERNSRSRSRGDNRRHGDYSHRQDTYYSSQSWRKSSRSPTRRRRQHSYSPDTTSGSHRTRRRDLVSPDDRKDRLSDRNMEESDRRNVSPRNIRRRRDSVDQHTKRSGDKSDDGSHNSPTVRADREKDVDTRSRERRRHRSRSPQEQRHSSYGRFKGRRSHSRSPVHNVMSRSKKHSHVDNSPKAAGFSQAKELTSKWARHHDSAESSSDEEDMELEKAFLGPGKEKKTEEEDLFGLGKLSQEMLK